MNDLSSAPWLRAIAPHVLLVLCGVVIALILAVKLSKHSLPPVRRSVVTLLASTLGIALAGLLTDGRFDTVASYLRNVALLLHGMALIKLFGDFAFKVALPIVRWNTQQITQDLFVVMLSVMWILVRLRGAGVDLTALVATSAVLTAVIGLSLQDTLGNVVGGLAMQLDAAIEVGDWVRYDNIVGRIVQISWRQTSIETNNWETVVVPNSQLIKSRVSVLGQREGQPMQLRRWIHFNVPNSVEPRRVIDCVELGLHRCSIPEVARQPPASCVLTEVELNYNRFSLRYWLTDLSRDDPTDSLVREHILQALQRENIPLAQVAANLSVTTVDDTHRRLAQEERLVQFKHALKQNELFGAFTDEELATLAARVRPAPFAKGEVMTKQGTHAHWLYLLTQGRARVELEGPNGSTRHVATLEPGTFFGEMGMMTGSPRQATVVAEVDSVCLRLDKAALDDVLRARPEVATSLSRVLAKRKAELDSVTLDLAARETQRPKPVSEQDVLARIRDFFGIGS